MSCYTCQQTNPKERLIRAAEERARTWAIANNVSSVEIIKLVNGSYSFLKPDSVIQNYTYSHTIWL